MAVQRLRTETRHSEIVIHNGTVYLAGQLADDFSGDVVEQTKQTLANIDLMLAEAGTDKSQILSVTIYLKDMERDYVGLNQVWDEWVRPGTAPARAAVEARMYRSDVLVEMTVVAALKN